MWGSRNGSPIAVAQAVTEHICDQGCTAFCLPPLVLNPVTIPPMTRLYRHTRHSTHSRPAQPGGYFNPVTGEEVVSLSCWEWASQTWCHSPVISLSWVLPFTGFLLHLNQPVFWFNILIERFRTASSWQERHICFWGNQTIVLHAAALYDCMILLIQKWNIKDETAPRDFGDLFSVMIYIWSRKWSWTRSLSKRPREKNMKMEVSKHKIYRATCLKKKLGFIENEA